jgi:hypothetical protein
MVMAPPSEEERDADRLRGGCIPLPVSSNILVLCSMLTIYGCGRMEADAGLSLFPYAAKCVTDLDGMNVITDLTLSV